MTLPLVRRFIGYSIFSLTLGLNSALALAEKIVDEQKLLLNPPPNIDSLSLNEARSIFSMRVRIWPDGSAITVFVLPGHTQLHSKFVKEKLRLLPHQLKRNWDRMVYTGIGRAPIEVADEQEMLARLQATPGSIGYTSMEVASEQLHILQVR